MIAHSEYVCPLLVPDCSIQPEADVIKDFGVLGLEHCIKLRSDMTTQGFVDILNSGDESWLESILPPFAMAAYATAVVTSEVLTSRHPSCCR